MDTGTDMGMVMTWRYEQFLKNYNMIWRVYTVERRNVQYAYSLARIEKIEGMPAKMNPLQIASLLSSM